MFRQRASQGSLRLQSRVLETGNNKEGVCAGINYFELACGTGLVSYRIALWECFDYEVAQEAG